MTISIRIVVTMIMSLILACAPEKEAPQTTQDAGTLDAGSPSNPKPMPLIRLNSDQTGTSFGKTYQGVVTEHGPARNIPANIADLEPARQLSVKGNDSSVTQLFYTLPKPYAFAAFPNDQVKITYRERNAGFGVSAGVVIRKIDDTFVFASEDGTTGAALELAERLGFTFVLDVQPLQTEDTSCGKKVRYGVTVENNQRRKRLFPGQSELYETSSDGVVEFTLLDAWTVEEATCGDAPAYSLGYIIVPKPQ